MKGHLPVLSGIMTAAAVVLCGGAAGAETPPPSPAPSPAVEAPLSWVDPPAARDLSYRRTLLLADGIAFAGALPFLVGAFAAAPEGHRHTDDEHDRLVTSVTPILAFSPLAFTGPIVHLTRGNGWRALASLGMRVLFFSAGTLVGAPVQRACGDSWGPCETATFALMIGGAMVVPTLLDASLFTAGERSASGRRAGLLLSPVLHVGEGGARFGLGASF